MTILEIDDKWTDEEDTTTPETTKGKHSLLASLKMNKCEPIATKDSGLNSAAVAADKQHLHSRIENAINKIYSSYNNNNNGACNNNSGNNSGLLNPLLLSDKHKYDTLPNLKHVREKLDVNERNAGNMNTVNRQPPRFTPRADFISKRAIDSASTSTSSSSAAMVTPKTTATPAPAAKWCYVCDTKVYLLQYETVLDMCVHTTCFRCNYCSRLLRKSDFEYLRDPHTRKCTNSTTFSITIYFQRIVVEMCLRFESTLLDAFYCTNHVGMVNRVEQHSLIDYSKNKSLQQQQPISFSNNQFMSLNVKGSFFTFV